ncbi:MAG: hypothetical protein MI784_13095, partial [Cytophagales bacterium]|nr:hypothetical protein [Cytophagales bacterium]
FNETKVAQTLLLESAFLSREGKTVGKSRTRVKTAPGEKKTVRQSVVLKSPELWHSDRPYLHDLVSSVKIGKTTVDGFRTRVGIRKVEFRGKDGLYINGKPFEDKLIGANRHQDFARIGNALPNSLHWRDVKKLRDAGMRVVRSAHYPQDPAFMDACDELGMFMIVPTPGWQFFNWKNRELFSGRVYDDIRQMVRRDRNHASVLLWEPVLNETRCPKDFAHRSHEIVHEEYPYQGAYTASDSHAAGHEAFDLLYAHPADEKLAKQKKSDSVKSVFTREWGDNVDDWNSHNSTSRVERGWGEQPQLIQALHYANPEYHTYFTCLERLYSTPRRHAGGTMWHAFDHQRGYHPDPFFGGILDAFRQPKYSYYMFMSQRDPDIKLEKADSGPFIFIANELSPVSPGDVTVFTNCDEVRLTVFGKVFGTKKVNDGTHSMPHPPVTFDNAYRFMDIKKLQRKKRHSEVEILAEGIIDGKVVATAKRRPSLRPTRLELRADYDGLQPAANGSDIVKVAAYLVDQRGVAKRLNREQVRFQVSGQGELIGGSSGGLAAIEWGTAAVLVRTGTEAGKIHVKASISRGGKLVPLSGKLTINTRPARHKLNYSELPTIGGSDRSAEQAGSREVEQLRESLQKAEHELHLLKQKETLKGQADFEGDVLGQ